MKSLWSCFVWLVHLQNIEIDLSKLLDDLAAGNFVFGG